MNNAVRERHDCKQWRNYGIDSHCYALVDTKEGFTSGGYGEISKILYAKVG